MGAPAAFSGLRGGSRATRRTCRLIAIAIMLAGTLAGCEPSGPELAPVSGRITLDGEPLATADVLFQPEESQPPSVGRTNSEGRYTLAFKRGVAGALVGPHTVKIQVVTEITGGPQIVPPRYNTESELRVVVEPDTENVFDFDLQSAAR